MENVFRMKSRWGGVGCRRHYLFSELCDSLLHFLDKLFEVVCGQATRVLRDCCCCIAHVFAMFSNTKGERRRSREMSPLQVGKSFTRQKSVLLECPSSYALYSASTAQVESGCETCPLLSTSTPGCPLLYPNWPSKKQDSRPPALMPLQRFTRHTHLSPL